MYTQTAMQYDKVLHAVLNQVLRAEHLSKVEGATEEHMGYAEAMGRPVGLQAPRAASAPHLLLSLCITGVKFLHFFLCGSLTFISISFLFINPEEASPLFLQWPNAA